MVNKLKEIEEELKQLYTSFKQSNKTSLLALREKNNALSRLEESLFWINKVISIHLEEEKRLTESEKKELIETHNMSHSAAYAHPKTTTISNTDALIASKALDSWNTNLCNIDTEGKASFNELVALCMKYKIPNLKYKDSYYTYTFIPKTGNHQWLKQDKKSEIVRKFSQ